MSALFNPACVSSLALCLRASQGNEDCSIGLRTWSKSKSCRAWSQNLYIFIYLYIFENLGKPHTAQSFRGGILDSGSCIAKYGTYVKIFMVEEAQTKHQSPLPPVHQPPLLEVEQDSFGTSVYNIPSSVPGGSHKSKGKNLVE